MTFEDGNYPKEYLASIRRFISIAKKLNMDLERSESIPLSDGIHIIQTFCYTSKGTQSCQKGLCWFYIFDNNGNRKTDYEIYISKPFLPLINHANGKNYLLFSIDLYAYSALDMLTYKTNHYMYNEEEDSFIWTDVLYSKKNNLLAVRGCEWGGPLSTEFYDFSVPERLPYPHLFSSFDLDGILDIGHDVTPVCWNDDGTIVLKCVPCESNGIITNKSFDIMSLIEK